MTVELICDNCGQLLRLSLGLKPAREWTWIRVNVGDSAYTFGDLALLPTECPDCKKAVEQAREQAAKEALAIRAVKSSRPIALSDAPTVAGEG